MFNPEYKNFILIAFPCQSVTMVCLKDFLIFMQKGILKIGLLLYICLFIFIYF